MGLCKGLVRYSVIAGLVGGAAVLVAGPERVSALIHQTRDKVNEQIDKAIDDPVALRQQLHDLEGQYPAKISDVRGDLAQLKEQVAQLQRDREISARVVELAQADLATLQPMLTKAEATMSQTAGVFTSSNAVVPSVRIVLNNESLDVKEAYARAERMQQVTGVYSARVNDIDRDLGYLAQQEQRLSDLVTTLETERQSFQSQMWALDRQIDAISRNDRIIDVMEKRQESIEEHSRYRVASLDQLTARFAEIRSRQEAQLESLGSAKATMNYERRAQIEMDARKATVGPMPLPSRPGRPQVIEIRPDSTTGAGATNTAQPVAHRID